MSSSYSKSTSLTSRALNSSLMLLFLVASVSCFSLDNYEHQQTRPSGAMLVARRAADDSRLLARRAARDQNLSQDSIVMGKFKVPAPDRIQQRRIPKSSESSSQVVSASFRVADDSAPPAKLVHGINGGSVQANSQNNLRKVKAMIQVSDEGLNYPPSKLSADIYGNVAEIVTAPPEAVDQDFLIPQSSSFFGNRRPTRSF